MKVECLRRRSGFRLSIALLPIAVWLVAACSKSEAAREQPPAPVSAPAAPPHTVAPPTVTPLSVASPPPEPVRTAQPLTAAQRAQAKAGVQEMIRARVAGLHPESREACAGHVDRDSGRLKAARGKVGEEGLREKRANSRTAPELGESVDDAVSQCVVV